MSDDITLLLAIVQQNKYTVFRDIQQGSYFTIVPGLGILYLMLYNIRGRSFIMSYRLMYDNDRGGHTGLWHIGM